MKRRFDIKKRTGNRNLISLILMTAVIVVMLLAYSWQLPEIHEQFDENYKNIDITFYDHSIQKINPSGKVKIDGQIAYQFDSISKSLCQDSEINLKKGKHIIEISTIDDQYKLIDTIEVVKYPMTYKLWIQFNYNPPIDQYKELVIDYSYNRSITEKNYTENKKANVFEQVTEKINQEFGSEVTYQPSKRYFTFSFKDRTHYLIE